MKNFLLLTATLILTLTASAAPSVIRKSGECKIVRADFDGKGAMQVPLKNADVEILCKLRADDFFGRDVVMANPEIKNLTAKPLDLAYHVAFFTKDGELVGSATQRGEIDPNGNMQFGSCIITVPKEEIAQVSAYKISVYVSEAKPKPKK